MPTLARLARLEVEGIRLILMEQLIILNIKEHLLYLLALTQIGL